MATGATPQLITGSAVEAAGVPGVGGANVATGGMRKAGIGSETAAACVPGKCGVPAGSKRLACTRSAAVATGSDGVGPSSMRLSVNGSETVAKGAQSGGGMATGGVQQAGLCSAAVATGALGGGGEVQAGEADEVMDTETTMNMAPVPRTSTVLPAIPPFDSSSKYNSMLWVSAVVKPGVQAVMDAVGGKADAAPAGHPRADEAPLTQQFPGAPGLQFTQSA